MPFTTVRDFVHAASSGRPRESQPERRDGGEGEGGFSSYVPKPKWSFDRLEYDSNVVHIQFFLRAEIAVAASNDARESLRRRMQDALFSQLQKDYVWFFGQPLVIDREFRASLRFGPCYDDEFMAASIAMALSAMFRDEILFTRVHDDCDDEFLLAELADFVDGQDEWDPEMAPFRVLIYDGRILLLRQPRTPLELSCIPVLSGPLDADSARLAISNLENQKAIDAVAASEEMMKVIQDRIDAGLINQFHRCVCRIPVSLAAVLRRDPQFISHCVLAMCGSSSRERVSVSRFLDVVDASSAHGDPNRDDDDDGNDGKNADDDESYVYVLVRFTRYLFALFESETVPFPKRLLASFVSPFDPRYLACERGLKLLIGAEYAYKLAVSVSSNGPLDSVIAQLRNPDVRKRVTEQFASDEDLQYGRQDSSTDWLQEGPQQKERDAGFALWKKKMEASTAAPSEEDRERLFNRMTAFFSKDWYMGQDGHGDRSADSETDESDSGTPVGEANGDEMIPEKETGEEDSALGGLEWTNLDKISSGFEDLLGLKERRARTEQILRDSETYGDDNVVEYLKFLDAQEAEIGAAKAESLASGDVSHNATSTANRPRNARSKPVSASEFLAMMGFQEDVDGVPEMHEEDDDDDDDDQDVEMRAVPAGVFVENGNLIFDDKTREEVLENLFAALQSEQETGGTGPMSSILESLSRDTDGAL
eukprot:ANDGO_04086.mRNA.1 hypothetical protein DICPUDRAFT_25982